MPTRWSGPPRRLRRTTTTRGFRRCYHAPYEYSVPGVEEDFLPQTEPMPPGIVLDSVMA